MELLALPANERPTAIFAPQTILADAVVRAIYEAGMRIPEDISVIGYTASDEPDFTSIKVPLDEIARQATEHLLKLLGSEKDAARLPDQPIAVTLIDSGTTAPPPDTNKARKQRGGDDETDRRFD